MAKASPKRKSLITDLGYPDLYTGFGPQGSMFQELQFDLWGALVSQLMIELPSRFDEALRSFLDFGRTGLWFVPIGDHYIRALGPDGFEDDFSHAWEVFRQIFNPPLDSKAEIYNSHRQRFEDFIRVWQILKKVGSNERFQPRRIAASVHCAGPFTGDQIKYLLRHYPSIVEAGAGNGYFLSQFRAAGGDGIGIDDETYANGMSALGTQLREEGVIHVDSGANIAKYARGRALAIFWPEPNSAFAAETVLNYAMAGGEHLLFKVGAYFGSRAEFSPDDFRQVGNSRDESGFTASSLMAVLAEHWVEVDNPPAFVPEIHLNNLWCFKRRS